MKEGQISLKHLGRLAVKYKYLFALCLIIALASGYVYLNYTQPKYEAQALLQLENNERSSSLTEQAIFAEFGILERKKNLENETMVLKSVPSVTQVVEQLELQYSYVALGRWSKRDLYKSSPVKVLTWEPREEGASLLGVLEHEGGNRFSLAVDGEYYFAEFGKLLPLPDGDLIMALVDQEVSGFPIEIKISPPISVAEGLVKELDVAILGENSSTIQISMRDVVAERASDILKLVVDNYLTFSTDDKNQVFKNTISLINERIRLINDELTDAELSVEEYKQRFNMVELSTESTLLLNELAGQNKEISRVAVEVDILQSVEDFLLSNKDKFEFVPTNTNISNLTLANQLGKFNEILAERDRLSNNLGPSHPDLLLAHKQLQNLRATIIENIRSIKSDLMLANGANRRMKSDMQARLKSLPTMERELLEMERQKSIKENLYLYLLQKREEAAISLAITRPSGRVVQPSYVPLDTVSPVKAQVWIIACFMGLFLPSLIVLLIESSNTKIVYESDVKRATRVPLVGALGYSKKKLKDLVVIRNSKSAVTEMFRMLRANLAYILPDQDLKTLLVTSSISSEGKSFISLNLGMTQAMAGKKVVILELDLRKPNGDVYRPAKTGKIGVVNYLVNPMLTVEEIVCNSGLHSNLDIIGSGPIPPNPHELILSARLADLVNELKERYDFVIVDAPPVGLVSDALVLNYFADATLYVVRAGVTKKAHLEIINDIYKKGKLPRPFIVLNGVKLNQPGGYREGYGAAYGRGYGYYRRDKSTLFGRLKMPTPDPKSNGVAKREVIPS